VQSCVLFLTNCSDFRRGKNLPMFNGGFNPQPSPLHTPLSIHSTGSSLWWQSFVDQLPIDFFDVLLVVLGRLFASARRLFYVAAA